MNNYLIFHPHLLPIGIFVIIGYYLYTGSYNTLLNIIWYYLNI